MIPLPRLTHRQKAIAITAAGIADFAQIMLIPTFLAGFIADEVIDFIIAIVLIAICGFKWQFVVAFLIELVPGLDLLPTWSAVVLTLPSVPEAANEPPAEPHVSAHPSTHPPIHVSAVAVPPVQPPPVQPQRRNPNNVL